MLQGIVLEKDSSNRTYRPALHVHNLARNSRYITLTLCDGLRTIRTNAPETISVRDHAATFADAARRLETQSLLPLDGDLEVEQVLKAYETFLARDNVYSFDPKLFEDMAAVCAWANDRLRGEEVLKEGRAIMKRWPKDVVERIGDSDVWLEDALRFIQDRQAMGRLVEQQMISLKIVDLPVRHLVGPRNTERNP
jgi:hypothetical protein